MKTEGITKFFIQEALKNKEGILTNDGVLAVETGQYTGRSPKDRFIVKDDITQSTVDWGEINQPMSEESFERLHVLVNDYLTPKRTYEFHGSIGQDEGSRLELSVYAEYAWHTLFAHHLFIRETKRKDENRFKILCAPSVKADPTLHGTNSETFIVVNLKKKIVLIGGTEYAGEMKKSMFSVMNYLLPEKNILPMHCSSNVGKEGDVALFFGLSGTGKTTLSADPNRLLIGDDEHGWSDRGVFNFEGGCYAKTLNLTKEKEPQIFDAITEGSLLENVIVENGKPDYNNDELTQNTRVAYPLFHIEERERSNRSGHPKTIFFLTADAFGVLPPISKLTPDQAMEYFLLGYTSKLAGTERGVKKPESVFSACFGSPFLPRKKEVYAKLLKEKIDEHQANVYLVNTGWTGGKYGEGERIKLSYTRAMIKAALEGKLEKVNYRKDEIFGLSMPETCPNVPKEVLDPKVNWNNENKYIELAKQLKNEFDKRM